MSAAPRRSFLPTTSYVVLGLLSFGRDLTGYELERWADFGMRFFFTTPAMSQIYRELARLEDLGLVRGRSSGGERTRRAYRLTARGRAELRRWLDEAPVDPPVLKHSVVLRLFFGHLTSPERMRVVLEEHRRWAEGMLAALDEVRAELGDEPTWTHARVVAGWGERFYGGEAAAAAEAAARLEQHDGRGVSAGGRDRRDRRV